MAAINFNALEFDSQAIPAPLPETEADPFPADCGLTAEQKSVLGQGSSFLGVLDTPSKVIEHWRLHAIERAQRAAMLDADAAKAKRYDPVLRAQTAATKTAHAAVVSAANQAWREAVAERNRALQEHEAKVAALRMEFIRLKNMKVD